jgi:hypothetical protein
VFWDSPGWPGVFQLLVLASWVLGLQTCTTTPGSRCSFQVFRVQRELLVWASQEAAAADRTDQIMRKVWGPSRWEEGY